MPDFNRLLEEQIPRLLRYARALTRNTERADDLVQDTLVRALAKQHLWQAGTNLRAWLFTLMHNQNVNNVRRGIHQGQNIDVEDMSNVLAATTDPTASRQLYELNRALKHGFQKSAEREIMCFWPRDRLRETPNAPNFPVH
jgi:RNA polymerase sigma-70 factor (ECF subfamily)